MTDRTAPAPAGGDIPAATGRATLTGAVTMALAEHLAREEVVSLLRVEADAITAAADRLDLHSFRRAVGLVCACEGKILTSGAGTSGAIARKLASTLTSVGIPAIFLHPSDALHGGLGLVGTGDVAVIMSNSGETDEVLALLPYLERRSVPLVAVVGSTDSTLARHAAAVLDAGAARESGPLNLAPTASTSVAMALGDALAMSAASLRGVTPEGFALNHPSGRLGKRLTLTVRDVMIVGERPRVAPGDSWLEVVSGISDGRMGAVTVEQDGHLVGIITDGDVRRTIARVPPGSLPRLRAAQFMSPNPSVVDAACLAYDALRAMEDRPSQISVMPVMHEGSCIGLVRLHDIVRSGV